jgi:ketosteroid isomerase-like protein
MNSALKIFTVLALLAMFSNSSAYAQEGSEEEVRKQITATGKAVREAFKKGDVETIKLYHHPDVVKALSYNNLKKGRKAVLDGLRETMSNFDMEFLGEKQEEVFIVKEDLVIEQLVFALRLIPKNGDDPFVFRGRTLIVLQRYEDSPTGWVTLHEIIQPFEK